MIDDKLVPFVADNKVMKRWWYNKRVELLRKAAAMNPSTARNNDSLALPPSDQQSRASVLSTASSTTGLAAMWVIGGLVRHAHDSDLYLIRGSLKSEDRIRIQRWSSGVVRTALKKDVMLLIPHDSTIALWETVTNENRRFALLHGVPNPRSTGLVEELNRFAMNCYQHDQIAPHREDFIRELVVLLSWWHTRDEPYITRHFVYKKIRTYCGMVGIDAPGWTLVKRRLCELEKLNHLL